MTLDGTQVALVKIAEERKAARERMSAAMAAQRPLNSQFEAGMRAGLSLALDILKDATGEDGDWIFPVASAVYLAEEGR